jgi:hypothetical protein
MTLVLLGLSLAAVSASWARSSGDATVKGEVVDLPCYEGKGGARGESHKSCAVTCAKKGNQLAIVEDGTNAIYVISGDYAANNNEKLVPFVAEMVQVKGTVSEKDGKKWLAVSSIKKIDKK